MTTTAMSCPACHAASPLRISYGMPTADFARDAESLGFAIGGCVVVDDAPLWECRSCGHRW